MSGSQKWNYEWQRLHLTVKNGTMSDIDTMNGRGYLLVLSLQIFVIDHENLERWIGSHRRNGPLSECPLSASAIFSLLSSRGGGGGNREVIVKNPSQSKSNRQLPLTLNWWLTVGFDFVFMWNKKENKKNVHPQKKQKLSTSTLRRKLKFFMWA